MIRKQSVYYFLLSFLIYSCMGNERDNQHQVQYYPNGKKKSVVITAPNLHNKYVKTFYPNGNLKKEFYYMDDKLEGEYKEYHENGELAILTTYKSGELNGKMEFFFPNGQLEEVSYAEDGKREGIVKKYNHNGNIKIEDYVISDFSYYKKIFHYYSNGKLDSIQEVFHARVEINSDTIQFKDTLEVAFFLPLPKEQFSTNNLFVKFDFMRDDSTRQENEYLYPANRISISHGEARKKFIIKDSGKQILYGFLAREKDGKEMIYSHFEHKFFVKPSAGVRLPDTSKK